MKSLFLTILLSLSLVSFGALAKKGDKKNPDRGGGTVTCPSYGCEDGDNGDRDNGGSYGETYEGGDRDGGYFDGGGYGGGDDGGGGMIGEIFIKRGNKTYPVTVNTKKEDRGDVIVYTTVTHEDINASETCTTITVTVVDKATGKAISSDSNTRCAYWPL